MALKMRCYCEIPSLEEMKVLWFTNALSNASSHKYEQFIICQL